MLVPRPGWAEHRADEDWWADLVAITRELLATSGVDARSIDAVATSAIGPCMLPVDADGAPLMNARAVRRGHPRHRPDRGAERDASARTRILERCGNALTSQSVGPKILWLEGDASRHLRADRARR